MSCLSHELVAVYWGNSFNLFSSALADLGCFDATFTFPGSRNEVF